jgi:hypothetical protein
MTLHEWGIIHQTDKATHHRYCDFYESEIGEPKNILEFGIKDGASLKMWRDRYNAKVTGVDIRATDDIWGVTLIKGSALDRQILNGEMYDLIIDDASHITGHQVLAFNVWWGSVKSGGHYIIEDIHCANHKEFNPVGFDLFDWLSGLRIPYKMFWRDKDNIHDSGTVILYK